LQLTRAGAQGFAKPARQWGFTLYHLGYLVCISFFRLGGFKVYGADNVPPEGPVLVVANHVSYLDPPAVGCALPRDTWFMAKAALFRIPLFGAMLPYLHAFPVRQGSADRGAIRKCLELLEEGRVVTVFPEGTRSPDGMLMRAQLGAALIALRSGASVVPAAITGTDRALPRHSPLMRPARVTVRFGPPVDLAGLDAGDRASLLEASRRITGGIAEQLLEDNPSAVPPDLLNWTRR
jgi:1-acyl-sn-glycerol-3-phosphate acyltransferase